jgi:hypothetical protein
VAAVRGGLKMPPARATVSLGIEKSSTYLPMENGRNLAPFRCAGLFGTGYNGALLFASHRAKCKRTRDFG